MPPSVVICNGLAPYAETATNKTQLAADSLLRRECIRMTTYHAPVDTNHSRLTEYNRLRLLLRIRNKVVHGVFALLAGSLALIAADLPDAPGRDTVKKVCAACHPAEVVLAKGMTREQWGNMVSNMISRGAKGTDAEFAKIVDYLSTNLPPKAHGDYAGNSGSGKDAGVKPARKASGGLIAQAGSVDKHVVDEVAANRGKTIYVAQCITCHGPRGRGTAQGADMVRSLVVLKDRYGSTIGPYLKKGHPTQSGAASASFTSAQIQDLSHFLHQKVEDTLRTGPYNNVLNVLTGDPKGWPDLLQRRWAM